MRLTKVDKVIIMCTGLALGRRQALWETSRTKHPLRFVLLVRRSPASRETAAHTGTLTDEVPGSLGPPVVGGPGTLLQGQCRLGGPCEGRPVLGGLGGRGLLHTSRRQLALEHKLRH